MSATATPRTVHRLARTQSADVEWMTKREAAERAHVSTKTIQRAIAAHELEASGGGSRDAPDVRIRRDHFDAWMTRRGYRGGEGTR